MNIDEIKNDYDWQEAFGFASCLRAVYNCAFDGFTIDDVASIIAADEGVNDGDDWLMVGVLKDGRFFSLAAWCDYTGWDCQSDGDAHCADTLQSLIRYCLSDKERARLHLELEESDEH